MASENSSRTSGGSLLASQLEQPLYSSSSSLLASTLSQGINLASEESKRNEILAQLILDGNRKQRAQAQHQASQGLLMCAPQASTSAASSAATASKHIPVASLPQQPKRCPLATSTVTSGEGQPLNLSKRMPMAPSMGSNLNSRRASEAAGADPTSEAGKA